MRVGQREKTICADNILTLLPQIVFFYRYLVDHVVFLYVILNKTIFIITKNKVEHRDINDGCENIKQIIKTKNV